MPEWVSGPVTVRAPATSANLGPGFDCLGLALDHADEVTAEVIPTGLDIEVAGEGAAEVPRDERHLVVTSMRQTFERLGAPQPGLRLRCVNRIPHGRGMGSSAAAIVAGIRLAAGLLAGATVSDADALEWAAGVEGHPDNVAACLLGGLTLAWASPERVEAIRLPVDPRISATILIGPDPVSTSTARGLLPAEVSHRDAAANAGRAAVLVAALSGRPDALLPGTEDRLHQAYRGPAMPETLALVTDLRAAGIPATVSGAGPSVLALIVDGDTDALDRVDRRGWRRLDLAIARAGAALIAPTGGVADPG